MLLLQGPSGGLAGDDCPGDSVCIRAVESGRTIGIGVENRETFTVTVTLRFSQLENLRPDRALPLTVTVPGKRTLPAVKLAVMDPGKKWKWHAGFDWVAGPRHVMHDPGAVYLLPYASGRTFRVLQGGKSAFTHQGEARYAVDFQMPEGTTVHAARGGTVAGVCVRHSRGGPEASMKEYNNFILIEHADGTYGEYAHLMQGGAAVSPGDVVRAGDLIGFSGNTGYSTEPHLHFWVYRAIDGRTRESFPVRFATAGAAAEIPLAGKAYTAR